MLKKPNRLTTNFEYKITKKYGQSYQTRYSFIYTLKPKNYIGKAKVGIIISNQMSKKAVDRNKLKRVFRAILKDAAAYLPDDYWVVIYPKHSSFTAKYEEINYDLNNNLSKIFGTR